MLGILFLFSLCPLPHSRARSLKEEWRLLTELQSANTQKTMDGGKKEQHQLCKGRKSCGELKELVEVLRGQFKCRHLSRLREKAVHRQVYVSTGPAASKAFGSFTHTHNNETPKKTTRDKLLTIQFYMKIFLLHMWSCLHFSLQTAQLSMFMQELQNSSRPLNLE